MKRSALHVFLEPLAAPWRSRPANERTANVECGAYLPPGVREQKDVMTKTRFEVVRQAIDVLFRRLERLPPSHAAEDLRGRVSDCMRKAGEWTASPPVNQRDDLMKRVLALHVELATLERQVPQIAAMELMAS
jgi:hypothetical protein